MVRDNQLGIMGSEAFWQNISFKKNAYLQASITILPLLISFIGEYKIKLILFNHIPYFILILLRKNKLIMSVLRA